ncbi:MAG: archaellin/type IV pilin N-terminal domain-containing protein [Nanoarchaeota archaeon]
MNKRGITPVVATALLIVIALVLAMIIFLWARSFLTEKNVKFGEPIENSCSDVVFDAEAINSEVEPSNLDVTVLNKGKIALYQIDLYSINTDSRNFIGTAGCDTGKTVNSGDSCVIKFVDSAMSSGQLLSLVPRIVGTKGQQNEDYACEDSGKELTVP